MVCLREFVDFAMVIEEDALSRGLEFAHLWVREWREIPRRNTKLLGTDCQCQDYRDLKHFLPGNDTPRYRDSKHVLPGNDAPFGA